MARTEALNDSCSAFARRRGWAGLPGRRAVLSSGISLVEIVVAIVVLAVVVFGAVAFMGAGRVGVERAAQKRAAVQLAHERLERARAGGYAGLVNASGTATYNSVVYTWTLTVTTLRADPADANSLYKHAEVSVTWTGAPAPVVLRTAMTP